MQTPKENENQLARLIQKESFLKEYREKKVMLIERELHLSTLVDTLAILKNNEKSKISQIKVFSLSDRKEYIALVSRMENQISALSSEIGALKVFTNKVLKAAEEIDKEMSQYGKVYKFERK